MKTAIWCHLLILQFGNPFPTVHQPIQEMFSQTSNPSHVSIVDSFFVLAQTAA